MRNARGVFGIFLALTLLRDLVCRRPAEWSCARRWLRRGSRPSSIGGTVVNGNGGKPEAGVWVIAETKSLPAPFRKIVVTDDQGRFLVPDLPGGAYKLTFAKAGR